MTQELFEWALSIQYDAMSGTEKGNSVLNINNLRKSEVLELFKVVKDHIQAQVQEIKIKPLIIEVAEDEDDDSTERYMQKVCVNSNVLSFWIENNNEE